MNIVDGVVKCSKDDANPYYHFFRLRVWMIMTFHGSVFLAVYGEASSTST